MKYGSASLCIQKNYRMWAAVHRRKQLKSATLALQQRAKMLVAMRRFQSQCRGGRLLQAGAKRSVARKNHVAQRSGARRLGAASRRAVKNDNYVQLLKDVIRKEREERIRREEEERRQKLEAAERAKAEAEAAAKKEAEAKGQKLCEQASACLDVNKVSEAWELLSLAKESFKTAGTKEHDEILEKLKVRIEKAEDRQQSKSEGEKYLVEAKRALREGKIEAAKTAINQAKTKIERSLDATIADEVTKVVTEIQSIEDKARYTKQGEDASEDASGCILQNDLDGAVNALKTAKTAFGRAGIVEEKAEKIANLEKALDKAREEQEKQKEQKQKEAKEKENIAAEELKAAEEQAEALRKEMEERDKAAKSAAKDAKEAQNAQLDNLAVSVGGYGHGRDSLNMSELAKTPKEKPKTEKPEGTPKVDQPVTLETDPPLEVIKEGWLFKQSKKLKKWQKRYFVLDNVALYYCRSPTSIPDGFFAIRRCQFHYSEKTCCFDVITPSRVFRMQTPEGVTQLREWAECYKKAMAHREFPYYHVEQTTRLDLSRELLLGVMSTGLRMVKLGLYDPGFEEEIAFYTFDEIYSWGASDLQTFEFRVATERMPYSFKTMHAQEIESRLEAKFVKWREWRLWKRQKQQEEAGVVQANTSQSTPSKGAHNRYKGPR